MRIAKSIRNAGTMITHCRCHGLPMKVVSLVFHIFTHSMKSFVNSVNLLLLAVKRGKYIGLQMYRKVKTTDRAPASSGIYTSSKLSLL
ncbi:hypothetical protein HanIR_Chr11g0554741 [Helianthus annuus]|nr:hypothetical protein HanIR_Chr11g0554741 [Helianthus annuus]